MLKFQKCSAFTRKCSYCLIRYCDACSTVVYMVLSEYSHSTESLVLPRLYLVHEHYIFDASFVKKSLTWSEKTIFYCKYRHLA